MKTDPLRGVRKSLGENLLKRRYWDARRRVAGAIRTRELASYDFAKYAATTTFEYLRLESRQGWLAPASSKMRITDDELKERHEFWKQYDVIVNRAKVASALGLSPNRVSELVGLGVLQYVSRRPLLFALEHCRGCYRDYQWWLKVREPGEKYVNP